MAEDFSWTELPSDLLCAIAIRLECLMDDDFGLMDDDFGWAQLPNDLLYDIAMRLESGLDMLAFSGVCSSWRAAYTNIRPFWRPPNPKPWLIMAENNDDNPLCIRTVVDLNNNKRYQIKLPETFGRHCWGCEDGWIFTLGLDMETHIFNPFTRARLSLPSALNLPLQNHVINFYEPNRRELVREAYILQVHVISPVPPNNNLLVMVIYHNYDLAAARPGDLEWHSLSTPPLPEGRLLQSLMHHGDSIAAVYEHGELRFIRDDFFLNQGLPPLRAQYLSMNGYIFSDAGSYLYLLDFFGNVLAVSRFVSDFPETEEIIRDPTIAHLTWSFEVFIFDFERRDWFRLHDIGNAALFVGNRSVACRASEGSGCRPNCIYFTDERPPCRKYMGHDSGVYFIKENKFERFYLGVDILSKFCPPFWFMPKLP